MTAHPLDGWFDYRFAIGYVLTLVQPVAKPQPQLPLWCIKKVTHRLRRFLRRLNMSDLKAAKRAWAQIPVKHRQRFRVAELGLVLLATSDKYTNHRHVVNYHHGPIGPCGLYSGNVLLAAFSVIKDSIPRERLAQLEFQYRMDDFTGGKGNQVTDEDVRLACAAACDVQHYKVAREIARRALDLDECHRSAATLDPAVVPPPGSGCLSLRIKIPLLVGFTDETCCCIKESTRLLLVMNDRPPPQTNTISRSSRMQ